MPFHKNEVCGMVSLCEGIDRISFYSPVPLVSVHVDVKVVNFTAQVVVTQEFVNRERNPLECIYFFPVEEEAAVVDFTAELEGRKIETIVKEKEAAREEYNEAVRNRQTAFLLEETKPDIFEIKIGHLSPGSGCKITMTYLSELPVEEGKTKVTIPITVAPRYIPASDGSAEAAKIASVQHDFSSPVQMEMNLQVLMKTEITSITSPSHSLASPTKKRAQEYFEANTKFSGQTANMDRDMIIYVESAEPHEPKVIIEKNEAGSSVAMLSFVPEFRLKDQAVEAVFLVDCSGSMSGQSMNLAKEALQVFLHSLPVTSFFNIIVFGSSFKSLFTKSKRYDDHSLQEAKSSAANISANLGGTEIFSPLQHIFEKPLLAGLARQVFVLTDGQVSNSAACIDLVRKNSSTNRVFTLGIGSSADRHLVKGMARAGMGTAAFTTQGEPITSKVINQLKNGLQPCISQVFVKWGKSNHFEGGGDVETEIIETKKTLFGYGKTVKKIKQTFSIQSQVPSKIPAIYDGSRLIAYKLLDGKIEANDEITVKAKTPEGDLEVNLNFCKDSMIEGNSVHQLFARKMIQELEEKHEQENKEETKKLITELGLKYKLASKYTSFVGVDEKQGKSREMMVTRHVKNQMPDNGGHAMVLGAMRSASFAVVDSAPRSYRGHMAPPGAAMPTFGSIVAKTGAAPRTRGMMSNNRTMCDSVTDSMGMSSSSEDECEEMFSTNESLTRSAPRQGMAMNSSSVSSDVVRLTMSQAANGSFPPKDTVTSILGINLKNILDAGAALSSHASFPTIWLTMVVVAFFKERCQAEKDVWELVADKAQKWLQTQDQALVTGKEDKATEFIKKMAKQ